MNDPSRHAVNEAETPRRSLDEVVEARADTLAMLHSVADHRRTLAVQSCVVGPLTGDADTAAALRELARAAGGES